MKQYEHVQLATQKVLGAWFNHDRTRFEIVPSEDEADLEATAERVEKMVNSLRVGDEQRSDALVIETLSQLLSLHEAGKLLWPISLAYGGSCVGKISKPEYAKLLLSKYDKINIARDELLNSKETKYFKYKKNDAVEQSRKTWVAMSAITMACECKLDELSKIHSEHVRAFIDVARRDGAWVDWLNLNNRRGIRFLASYLGEIRKDPNFGYGRANYGSSGRTFKRNIEVFETLNHLSWLKELYNSYVNGKNLMGNAWGGVPLRLMGDYYSTLPSKSCLSPDVALTERNLKEMLVFASSWSTVGQRLKAINGAQHFIKWYQHSLYATGKTQLQLNYINVEFDAFISKCNSKLVKSHGSDVDARPMPTHYHRLLRQIISENDFEWPKSIKSKKGEPTYFIPIVDEATGRQSLVFCPVIPRLLMLLLDVPIRAIQARRLDSGEGDGRRWNADTGLWGPSDGKHNGYWERQYQVLNAKRGVIREMSNVKGDTISGLWINSNKTQDRKNLFDETSGYEIPWQNKDVLLNIDTMRTWQETYNPVKGPISFADIPKDIFPETPGESIINRIPDRFYLFRYPINTKGRGREAPPSHTQITRFFHLALAELERRLNEEDPERPVKLITSYDRADRPTSAVFTVHGMRSSTLTGLHLAGVPLEILSKVVAGHASILMTLKYLKFDPLHISQVLNEANFKSIANARDEFPNYLKKASFEHAVRMTARLTDDGLTQASGTYSEPSCWTKLDIGLCPNGSTQCHIGGPILVKSNKHGRDESVYAPVPGGRNCVRCRFFITGLPFLIPLWTHGMSLLARAEGHARRAAARDEEVRALKGERMAVSASGRPVPPDLRDRIDVRMAEAEAARDKRDETFADFHATLALVEKIRAISPEAGEGALPMLLPAAEMPSMVGRESTRFEVADAVVQASRFFPSIETPELERERDAFLDQILYRNGYVPITMAPLTPSEKRRAADAMSAMLLIEIQAMETQDLIEGRRQLDDFGLKGRLEDACRQAIGTPIGRLALAGPRGAPVTIDAVAAA